jgi:hypothetical protein
MTSNHVKLSRSSSCRSNVLMGMLITSTAETGIRYLICTKDSGKDKKTYRVGSKETKRAQVERDNWWNCIAKQV